MANSKVAKKPTKAEAFLRRLDRVIASFQDLDKDWTESFQEYVDLAMPSESKTFLQTLRQQEGFEEKVDALELAMALHPAADPIRIYRTSTNPFFDIGHGPEVVLIRKIFDRTNYKTIIGGLAANPILPIWHDAEDESFLDLARLSITSRLVAIFDFANTRHDTANQNSIRWLNEMADAMKTALLQFLTKNGVVVNNDRIDFYGVGYSEARSWTLSMEERGRVIELAAFTDRLCQIAEVPRRYRFDHLYRHILPEPDQEQVQGGV